MLLRHAIEKNESSKVLNLVRLERSHGLRLIPVEMGNLTPKRKIGCSSHLTNALKCRNLLRLRHFWV